MHLTFEVVHMGHRATSFLPARPQLLTLMPGLKLVKSGSPRFNIGTRKLC